MTYLRFTVADGSRLHDVELSASAESTVASILDALPIRIGNQPAYVGPHLLRPEETLADSSLIPGCFVSIGAPGAEFRQIPDDAVGVLRVISGPDIGTWCWILRDDGVLIGREGDVGLHLPGDAQVSRKHAEVASIDTERREVTVRDVGSQNGTTVGGARIETPTPLPAGGVFGVGESIVQWTPLERVDHGWRRAPEGRIEFDRRFHSAPIPEPVTVELPTAPSSTSRNALVLIGSIAAPLGLGLVTYAVTQSPLALLASFLLPITLALPQIAERRNRRRQNAEFEAGKARATAEIVTAVTAQEQVRRLNDPDELALTLSALGVLPGLWTKKIGGRDALTVRVGVRDEPAEVDLRGQRWTGLSSPMMRSVPVTVDLSVTGALSVVGDLPRASELARWMLLQLATRRSPEDLMIYVFGHDGGEHLKWTAWLPHVDAGDLAGAPCRIAVSRETRNALAEELKGLLDAREIARNGESSVAFDSDVVVLLDRARTDRLLPGMRAVLQRGPDVGIHLICVDTEDIHECRGRVRVASQGGLEIIRGWNDAPESASAETSHLNDAERLARLLAPMRDRVQAASSAGGMPTRSRYLDLIGLADPSPEDVIAVWSSNPGPTTRIPLGADDRGTVYVDLAKQGPHTMLGGAPGAGKSILLRTLVASLLLHNRPDELNLVLVDFKGGAAFLPFENCPQVVALIRSTGDTPADVFDEAAAIRVLASIRAEVDRREALLSHHGGEIDEYLLDRPIGESPLPRLVLIFDEFARVLNVSSGFVTELVNVASKGRSLGMHLVFATQSLQGKLNAEMKNNIEIRVSLRQNQPADSQEVLDIDDAAHIPGRLRGRGLILAMKDEPRVARPFQTGYLGDPPPQTGTPPATGRLIDWPAVADPRPDDDEGESSEPTDQDRLIAAIEQAASKLSLPKPFQPLRPSLPAAVSLEDLDAIASEPAPANSLPYGLADLPKRQKQPVEYLSLTGDEQLMIAGGARSGRTTAVKALIHSAATRFGSDQLHLYILEREPAGLSTYEALPHCGAVIGAAERDRVRRFVTWLDGETGRRQAARLAGRDADPQILVLIDGWELIHDLSDPMSMETSLIQLLRGVIKSGPKVGVRTVVTCEHLAFARKPGDLFATKLVLPFTQAELVKSAMPSGTVPPPRLAGRAAETSTGRHIQIAEPEQSAAELTNRLSRSNFDCSSGPRPFPAMPERVNLNDLARPSGVSAGWVPLGIGGPDLSPIGVDLFDGPQLLLVSGKIDSGTSDAAMSAAVALSEHGVGVVVITTNRSPVGPALAGRPGIAVLTGPTLPDSSVRAAASALGTQQVVVLVDDCDQITVTDSRKNSFDDEAPTLLEEAVTPDRLGRMGLILCGDAMPFLTGPRRGLTPLVKRAITGGAHALLLPTVTAAREHILRLEADEYFSAPPGRGYLTIGSHRTLVQLASPLETRSRAN